MARRRERKDVVAQLAIEPRVVDVEGARELVTIGPDAPIWKVDLAGAFRTDDLCAGKIVRLIPPHDATDEQVAGVRAAVASAAAVRLMPRRRVAVVVEEKAQGMGTSAHRRARDVVLQMVEEANTRDRSALRAFCEQVMARAGM